MDISTIADLKTYLRRGVYSHGYPSAAYTDDGDFLCNSCILAELPEVMRAVRDRDRSGWRVTATDVYWEGAPLTCDHCGRRLPSAYGDPDGAPCYVKPSDDAGRTRYPWKAHTYPATPVPGWEGSAIPAVCVTRSPGGCRARWASYNTGIGLSHYLVAIDRAVRDPSVNVAAVLRTVAAARAADLDRCLADWR